jgi:signal transduction histidine kinase
MQIKTGLWSAAAALILSTIAVAQTGESGTSAEAKAMLDKAVAAVKADKAKALDTFNRGEGGFKDRDLYVFCLNASDGVLTAHPKIKGAKAQTLKDANGFAFGEKFLSATDGKVSEVAYVWPRPGSDKPVPKVTYFTKVADQICGVGYYK